MVPFLDLKAQYLSIKPEIDTAVIDVLGSTQFVLGEAVARFEKKFAEYCQTKHAIACSSGTAALHLALKAAGIGSGDEVIVPSMTFIATASAVDLAKAVPVFIDVEPETGTMDCKLIGQAITPQTKAIMPVHLYGQVSSMEPLIEIAEHHGLMVIEDAAQAHGAEQNGKRAGSLGQMGCFSFYPGKNLGAYGEGGCVVTSDDKLARRLRMLRDWGQEEKFNHVLKGFNYRMDGIQGAVLDVKMNHIEDWTEKRRQAAQRYNDLLSGIEGVKLPVEAAGNRHAYHVYGIRIDAAVRDDVLSALRERDIHCGLHYPIPVHMQTCFSELGYKAGDLPQTEAFAAEELSLPMFPEMSQIQQQEVAGALRECLAAS